MYLICEYCKKDGYGLEIGYCWKCMEFGRLSCYEYFSEHVLCDKCLFITAPRSSIYNENKDYFINKWRYIYYYGIKENGIMWYRKARDKLIKKINDRIENSENIEKRKNLQLKKEIDKWK